MSMIPTWELTRLQTAAEQMCYRLGANPHIAVNCEDGVQRPQWVLHAIRMYEHLVMVEAMRAQGLPV